jgi:hypothetical protein
MSTEHLPLLELKVAAIFLPLMLSAIVPRANAGESYFYQGTSGYAAEFHLIGGQYTLYLYAKRPVKGYNAPETRSCLFSGNLQRLSPTQDAMSLGSGITISTIVPHKIGPAPLTMPAGRYRIFIASLTDCDWHFNLESTDQNVAGVSPVRMLRAGKAGREFSETASRKDQVQFYAQYRTEHDAQALVSGVVQLIDQEKAVQTFPLKVGVDDVTRATTLYVDIQWDQGDTRYLGKNTAKFIVKIGSAEFTTTGEFTLTP